MKRDFDFNRVGKRLPYTVPDDFFAKLEDGIYNKVAVQKKRKAGNARPFMRVTFAALATAAAAVILFFAIGGSPDEPSHGVCRRGAGVRQSQYGRSGVHAVSISGRCIY